MPSTSKVKSKKQPMALQSSNKCVNKDIAGPSSRRATSPITIDDVRAYEYEKDKRFERAERERRWRTAKDKPAKLDHEEIFQMKRLTFAVMLEDFCVFRNNIFKYKDLFEDCFKKFLCDVSPTDRQVLLKLSDDRECNKISIKECRKRVEQLLWKMDYEDSFDAEKQYREYLLSLDMRTITDSQLKKDRLLLEREGRMGLRPDGQNEKRFGEKRKEENKRALEALLARADRERRRCEAAQEYSRIMEELINDKEFHCDDMKKDFERKVLIRLTKEQNATRERAKIAHAMRIERRKEREEEEGDVDQVEDVDESSDDEDEEYLVDSDSAVSIEDDTLEYEELDNEFHLAFINDHSSPPSIPTISNIPLITLDKNEPYMEYNLIEDDNEYVEEINDDEPTGDIMDDVIMDDNPIEDHIEKEEEKRELEVEQVNESQIIEEEGNEQSQIIEEEGNEQSQIIEEEDNEVIANDAHVHSTTLGTSTINDRKESVEEVINDGKEDLIKDLSSPQIIVIIEEEKDKSNEGASSSSAPPVSTKPDETKQIEPINKCCKMRKKAQSGPVAVSDAMLLLSFSQSSSAVSSSTGSPSGQRLSTSSGSTDEDNKHVTRPSPLVSTPMSPLQSTSIAPSDVSTLPSSFSSLSLKQVNTSSPITSHRQFVTPRVIKGHKVIEENQKRSLHRPHLFANQEDDYRGSIEFLSYEPIQGSEAATKLILMKKNAEYAEKKELGRKESWNVYKEQRKCLDQLYYAVKTWPVDKFPIKDFPHPYNEMSRNQVVSFLGFEPCEPRVRLMGEFTKKKLDQLHRVKEATDELKREKSLKSLKLKAAPPSEQPSSSLTTTPPIPIPQHNSSSLETKESIPPAAPTEEIPVSHEDVTRESPSRELSPIIISSQVAVISPLQDETIHTKKIEEPKSPQAKDELDKRDRKRKREEGDKEDEPKNKSKRGRKKKGANETPFEDSLDQAVKMNESRNDEAPMEKEKEDTVKDATETSNEQESPVENEGEVEEEELQVIESSIVEGEEGMEGEKEMRKDEEEKKKRMEDMNEKINETQFIGRIEVNMDDELRILCETKSSHVMQGIPLFVDELKPSEIGIRSSLKELIHVEDTDEIQLIGQELNTTHILSDTLPQLENEDELKPAIDQSCGRVVSIRMGPASIHSPTQSNNGSPQVNHDNEYEIADPNLIAYYRPNVVNEGGEDEEDKDDKSLVRAREARENELARGLDDDDGGVIGGKRGVKRRRRQPMQDSSYKLLVYLYKSRYDDDLLPSQRHLKHFADVIQNRINNVTMRETNPQEWSRDFYKSRFSSMITSGLYSPVPKSFETDLLVMKTSSQFEEWRSGREVSANLLEEAVRAEKTPFKLLIDNTLNLKDSFTIVRARAVFNKILQDISQIFDDLMQGDEDENEDYKSMMVNTSDQVKTIFVFSFYVISHSISINNKSRTALKPYELLRVFAYVLEGWVGWMERGGIYRLFIAQCERAEKEGRYVPLGKEKAAIFKDRIDTRVSSICAPLQSIEDGGEEAVVVYMLHQLKEKNILIPSTRSIRDKEDQDRIFRCGHNLGNGQTSCLLEFKSEEELQAHKNIAHLRRARENAAATKCTRCARYFLMESSLALHRLIAHHDYDDNEEENENEERRSDGDDNGDDEDMSDKKKIRMLCRKVLSDFALASEEWNPHLRRVKVEEESNGKTGNQPMEE